MPGIEFWNSGGGGGTQVNIETATLDTNLPEANNTFGSVGGVVISGTANAVSIPSSPEAFKLRGFSATGNGDGYFYLTVDGTTVLSGRIHNQQKSIIVALPNAQLVATSSEVLLKVLNESEATCSYEGTILGE